MVIVVILIRIICERKHTARLCNFACVYIYLYVYLCVCVCVCVCARAFAGEDVGVSIPHHNMQMQGCNTLIRIHMHTYKVISGNVNGHICIQYIYSFY